MSFLTMDMTAIRMSMNNEDRVKAEIKDLQVRGRELKDQVMSVAHVTHITFHILLTALVLFSTSSLLTLIIPNQADIIAVFLTLVFGMIKKDQVINPIIEEITSFITRNKIKEIDELKDSISTKANSLMNMDKAL